MLSLKGVFSESDYQNVFQNLIRAVSTLYSNKKLDKKFIQALKNIQIQYKYSYPIKRLFHEQFTLNSIQNIGQQLLNFQKKLVEMNMKHSLSMQNFNLNDQKFMQETHPRFNQLIKQNKVKEHFNSNTQQQIWQQIISRIKVMRYLGQDNFYQYIDRVFLGFGQLNKMLNLTQDQQVMGILRDDIRIINYIKNRITIDKNVIFKVIPNTKALFQVKLIQKDQQLLTYVTVHQNMQKIHKKGRDAIIRDIVAINLFLNQLSFLCVITRMWLFFKQSKYKLFFKPFHLLSIYMHLLLAQYQNNVEIPELNPLLVGNKGLMIFSYPFQKLSGYIINDPIFKQTIGGVNQHSKFNKYLFSDSDNMIKNLRQHRKVLDLQGAGLIQYLTKLFYNQQLRLYNLKQNFQVLINRTSLVNDKLKQALQLYSNTAMENVQTTQNESQMVSQQIQLFVNNMSSQLNRLSELVSVTQQQNGTLESIVITLKDLPDISQIGLKGQIATIVRVYVSILQKMPRFQSQNELKRTLPKYIQTRINYRQLLFNFQLNVKKRLFLENIGYALFQVREKSKLSQKKQVVQNFLDNMNKQIIQLHKFLNNGAIRQIQSLYQQGLYALKLEEQTQQIKTHIIQFSKQIPNKITQQIQLFRNWTIQSTSLLTQNFSGQLWQLSNQLKKGLNFMFDSFQWGLKNIQDRMMQLWGSLSTTFGQMRQYMEEKFQVVTDELNNNKIALNQISATLIGQDKKLDEISYQTIQRIDALAEGTFQGLGMSIKTQQKIQQQSNKLIKLQNTVIKKLTDEFSNIKSGVNYVPQLISGLQKTLNKQLLQYLQALYEQINKGKQQTDKSIKNLQNKTNKGLLHILQNLNKSKSNGINTQKNSRDRQIQAISQIQNIKNSLQTFYQNTKLDLTSLKQDSNQNKISIQGLKGLLKNSDKTGLDTVLQLIQGLPNKKQFLEIVNPIQNIIKQLNKNVLLKMDHLSNAMKDNNTNTINILNQRIKTLEDLLLKSLNDLNFERIQNKNDRQSQAKLYLFATQTFKIMRSFIKTQILKILQMINKVGLKPVDIQKVLKQTEYNFMQRNNNMYRIFNKLINKIQQNDKSQTGRQLTRKLVKLNQSETPQILSKKFNLIIKTDNYSQQIKNLRFNSLTNKTQIVDL